MSHKWWCLCRDKWTCCNELNGAHAPVSATYYYMTKTPVADWYCLWLHEELSWWVTMRLNTRMLITSMISKETVYSCLIVFHFREILSAFGERAQREEVNTQGLSKFVKSYSTWHSQVRTWPLHVHFHIRNCKVGCHCVGQKMPVANNHLESLSQFSPALTVPNSNSVRHTVYNRVTVNQKRIRVSVEYVSVSVNGYCLCSFPVHVYSYTD